MMATMPEATPAKPRKSKRGVLLLIAWLVAIANLSLTPCICGLYNFMSIPGLLIVAVLWFFTSRGVESRWSNQVAVRLFQWIILLFCFPVIVDLLWGGHDAIVPETRDWVANHRWLWLIGWLAVLIPSMIALFRRDQRLVRELALPAEPPTPQTSDPRQNT